MSQEVPSFYGTHRFFTIFTKTPPLVYTLSQMNPVHTSNPVSLRPI